MCRNKITKVLKEALGDDYRTYAQKITALSGKKSAIKNRGRKLPHTAEWNAKIGESQKGKKLSQATKDRISISLKLSYKLGQHRIITEGGPGGRKFWLPEKHKEAMKKAVETKRKRGYYELHAKRHSEWMKLHAPMRGKKMSQESREKMSAAKKRYYENGGQCHARGRMKTPQERKKLSQSTVKMWKEGKFKYGNGLFRSKLEIQFFEEFQRYDPATEHSFKLITQDKTYVFDVFVPSLNLVVEINGDYWHLNPSLYDASYRDESRQVTAQDVWASDEIRIQVAKSHGHNAIVIWESDAKRLGTQFCVQMLIDNFTSEDVDQSK